MRPAVLQIVIDALVAVLEGGRPADRVLERALRQCRDLAADERAMVARRVLGVACLHGRLDFRLDQACPGWREDPPRWRIAAYACLEEGMPTEQAAAECRLGAALLSRLQATVIWPENPVARLGAEHSFPEWLAARFWSGFGADAGRLAEVLNRPGPVVVRANALKVDREGLRQRLAAEGIEARATALSPWGLELGRRSNIFGSPAWREGLFEVQDEGSQLVAAAVDARPGERVIDFCAGAGGKTLALAAMMEDRGSLEALDVDAPRLVNLAARRKRAGATIIRTRRIEADRPLPAIEPADRVLVDAPCSALGTLRRSPDLRWKLAPEAIARFAGEQREILERASALVRPGGLLVYATCTLTPEENEGVAEAFSRAHPDWRRAREPLLLLPHVHGTDGFYVAFWRR